MSKSGANRANAIRNPRWAGNEIRPPVWVGVGVRHLPAAIGIALAYDDANPQRDSPLRNCVMNTKTAHQNARPTMKKTTTTGKDSPADAHAARSSLVVAVPKPTAALPQGLRHADDTRP